MAREFVVEFDFDEEMGYPNSIKTGFTSEEDAEKWAKENTTSYMIWYQYRVA